MHLNTVKINRLGLSNRPHLEKGRQVINPGPLEKDSDPTFSHPAPVGVYSSHRRFSLKLGIPVLVIGLLVLFLSIPFSVIVLIIGFNQVTLGNISGGILAWAPIVGVVLGLVMTTIGASRVFKD
jgi:hypothetical protein